MSQENYSQAYPLWLFEYYQKWQRTVIDKNPREDREPMIAANRDYVKKTNHSYNCTFFYAKFLHTRRFFFMLGRGAFLGWLIEGGIRRNRPKIMTFKMQKKPF